MFGHKMEHVTGEWRKPSDEYVQDQWLPPNDVKKVNQSRYRPGVAQRVPGS